MPKTFDFNAHQRGEPFEGDKPQNANSPVRHLLVAHRTMPRLQCADGFHMSVQASEFHYCTPRESSEPHYSHVEVGFPSAREESLMPYINGDDSAPTDTVYAWVPVDVVNAIINAHGGLSDAK